MLGRKVPVWGHRLFAPKDGSSTGTSLESDDAGTAENRAARGLWGGPPLPACGEDPSGPTA